MLKTPSEFGDKDQAVDLWLSRVVAYDPDTGAALTKSDGRRRAGSPRRYYVDLPETPGSRYNHKLFGLTALTDAEAIVKANAKLAKLMKHSWRWNDDTWAWERVA